MLRRILWAAIIAVGLTVVALCIGYIILKAVWIFVAV